MAMNLLACGLSEAEYHEDTLSVREAELSLARRLGAPEEHVLTVQNNLANTYEKLGRLDKALPRRRDVYSGRLKLNGEEHRETFIAALNFASTMVDLQRVEEVKSLFRRTVPVARRVLGENDFLTLVIRGNYAKVLYKDPSATLDDLREAVSTFEDTERIARRVLGGGHPFTKGAECELRKSRAALRAGETP